MLDMGIEEDIEADIEEGIEEGIEEEACLDVDLDFGVVK